MEETIRRNRDHPLETSVGILYAEPQADDSLIVTSGRIERNWSTGRSWGLESVRVRRRNWRVQIRFHPHADGSFAVGAPGHKPVHSQWGDYFIVAADDRLLDGLRRRKFRKAIKTIIAAASEAVNNWASGEVDLEVGSEGQARGKKGTKATKSKVVVDDGTRLRRARLFSLQIKLEQVERELADLSCQQHSLERRAAVLDAQKRELAAAIGVLAPPLALTSGQ